MLNDGRQLTCRRAWGRPGKAWTGVLHSRRMRSRANQPIWARRRSSRRGEALERTSASVLQSVVSNVEHRWEDGPAITPFAAAWTDTWTDTEVTAIQAPATITHLVGWGRADQEASHTTLGNKKVAQLGMRRRTQTSLSCSLPLPGGATRALRPNGRGHDRRRSSHQGAIQDTSRLHAPRYRRHGTV